MTAMLLRINKISILVLILGVSRFCLSQSCIPKLSFKSDIKYLPKNICINKDETILRIYSRYDSIDLNLDGRLDLVFASRREKHKIGDSTFLYVYIQAPDSSFLLLKKYRNLLPIYFDPDIETSNFTNQDLLRAFDCYGVPIPLIGLEIKKDSLSFLRVIGNQEQKLYKYKFSKTANDWILYEKDYLIGDNFSIKETIFEKTSTLTDFSFCQN